jgi:hypothetical protein
MPSSLLWLSSLACQRPHSPAVVVAAAATNGGECAGQIIAVPPPHELSVLSGPHLL